MRVARGAGASDGDVVKCSGVISQLADRCPARVLDAVVEECRYGYAMSMMWCCGLREEDGDWSQARGSLSDPIADCLAWAESH